MISCASDDQNGNTRSAEHTYPQRYHATPLLLFNKQYRAYCKHDGYHHIPELIENDKHVSYVDSFVGVSGKFICYRFYIIHTGGVLFVIEIDRTGIGLRAV